jgi:hypothetical protein
MIEIIPEMINHFKRRTNMHINLVKKYANELIPVLEKNNISWVSKFKNNINQHDNAKLQDSDIVTPYILITWEYYCKKRNIPFEITDKYRKKMHDATVRHCAHNKHHPEYWDPGFSSKMINFNSRDEPTSTIVNATKMDAISLAEMVCDWCAVSEEKNTCPYEWLDKNLNIRWHFNDNQIKFIKQILKAIWLK